MHPTSYVSPRILSVVLFVFALLAVDSVGSAVNSVGNGPAQFFVQQGPKLVGTGAIGTPQQGGAVSISGDGNTAIVGGQRDNNVILPGSGAGAAWVYTRSVGGWIQQAELVGSGAIGLAHQGWSVAISADGDTAIVGGYGDNGNIGAAWVWAKSGGVWTQQSKLIASDAVGNAEQGGSVALSADGNTAIVGGGRDNNVAGAAWVWTRSGGVWAQQRKLVASGAVGNAQQGSSVSLASDGNTAIVGGNRDNSNAGAAWIWTRSGGVWTQGPKLVGSGATNSPLGAYQGNSVFLSGDGNTAIVGGPQDNNLAGAAWIWTRSGGIWTPQGNKLVGSGTTGNAEQGYSVALSGDGNTAIVGGPFDASFSGQAWIWTRSAGVWSPQVPKLVGSGAVGGAEEQGLSVSLSADGQTAIVGGPGDNASAGAAWVFTTSAPTTLSIANTAFNPSTATVGVVYFANSAVMATGGVTPYSWSATGFPNGMSINSSSGALFGTPTVAGTFNVIVTVRDSSSPQQTAPKMLPITVVASGTPPVPVLNSPADGTSYQANTTSVNLAWGAVTAASTYNLQVGTSCGGTSIANWNQAAPSSLVSGLSNGTTYSWRVQSVGPGGTSVYSNCRSFHVNSVSGSPPSVPVLSLPTDGASFAASTTTAALSWGAVTGATYHLQVGTSCGGIQIADWNQTAASSLVLRLSNGTTYFWRVQSIGAGGTSPFQTCRTFSVGSTASNSAVVHPQYQGCYPYVDNLGHCAESPPHPSTPWGNHNFGTPKCEHNYNGSTIRCTFNTSACVVTVFSMALNFVLNGRDLDPEILNNYLVQLPNGHGYTNGGDIVGPTIATIKYPLTQNGSAIFSWVDQSGPNTVERLSAALDSGYPVYVRVQYNPQLGTWQHGVLVSGYQVIGGVTHFFIRDPGRPSDGDLDSTQVDLNRYNNVFKIQGYLRPRSGQNFSGLQHSVNVNPDEAASLAVSSAEGTKLMLIDPAGHRVGFDPGLQQQVNEIPNSSYDDKINLDPLTLDPSNSAPVVRTIGVGNPMVGTYQVVSYGVTTGTYELDIKSISGTGQLQSRLISGNIQAGATVNNTFDYPDDATTLRTDSINPPAGRTSGGQQVTLIGEFAVLSTVTIGGLPASFIYTNGSGDTSKITVTTPAHAVGAVQIDLTPTAGSVLSKANAFAYLPTVFTDDTIVVGQTTAKAQHIIELRQAIDAMRAVAGLNSAPWTDAALVPTSTTIKAVHIAELRTYLDDAATRLGYATQSYTDPGLTAGFLTRSIYVEELRQRIRTIAR